MGSASHKMSCANHRGKGDSSGLENVLVKYSHWWELNRGSDAYSVQILSGCNIDRSYEVLGQGMRTSYYISYLYLSIRRTEEKVKTRVLPT